MRTNTYSANASTVIYVILYFTVELYFKGNTSVCTPCAMISQLWELWLLSHVWIFPLNTPPPNDSLSHIDLLSLELHQSPVTVDWGNSRDKWIRILYDNRHRKVSVSFCFTMHLGTGQQALIQAWARHLAIWSRHCETQLCTQMSMRTKQIEANWTRFWTARVLNTEMIGCVWRRSKQKAQRWLRQKLATSSWAKTGFMKSSPPRLLVKMRTNGKELSAVMAESFNDIPQLTWEKERMGVCSVT